MMHSRRNAREAALQALYGCDQLNAWTAEAVDGYFSLHHPDLDLQQPCEHYVFSRTLIDGVLKHFKEIDEIIQAASLNWKVAGMCKIDRNILRIAAFEMKHLSDIPAQVAINEAIEIAKSYGGDESPRFINAILDSIAASLK